MGRKKTRRNLNQELESITKKMRRIQKKIRGDDQPASMHELDQLSSLGKDYTKIIEALTKNYSAF